MTNRILFQTDAVCVEYFSAAHAKLALLFSPQLRGDLSGNPDQGVRLLQQGFDVLAFKINNEDWFQSVPANLLKALANLILRRRYQETVAYGTALGAYAAAAFSGWFNPQRALLISPQFSVDDGFALSQDCTFFICYDPHSSGQQAVEKLRALIPDGKLRLITVPFAGEPSGTCLMEAGLLAQLEHQVLAQAAVGDWTFRRAKAGSVAYLFHLGTALLQRNKRNTALGVTAKALQINPQIGSLHARQAAILAQLGKHQAAIAAWQTAIALEPDNPEWHYQLSLGLLHLDRVSEALNASSHVMQLVTDNHGFWGYHSNLLWRNGQTEASLAAILTALELDPTNAHYHAHKSGMLQALARLDDAILAASDALALAPDDQALLAHLNALRLKKQQSLPVPVLPPMVNLDQLLAPWR